MHKKTGKRYREMTARELVVIELKAVGVLAVTAFVGYSLWVMADAVNDMLNVEVQDDIAIELDYADMTSDSPWGAGYSGENVPVDRIEVAPVEEDLPEYHKEAQPATVMTPWATCRITAYCPCEKCCGKYALNRPIDENGKPIVHGASGATLTSYASCASSLPFGTKLYIPDLDLYTTVQDRAAESVDSATNGKYVDIYIDDHDTCFSYLAGKNRNMEVYIVE